MKTRAKLIGAKQDKKTKHIILEFEALDNLNWETFKKNDDILDLSFKKYRKKRSLNANNYAWALITQLADKVNVKKEDLYKEYIRDINVYRDIEINKEATATLIYSWQLNGLGWIAEKLDISIRADFELVRLHYGSSVYNTKQMSKFIQNIVEDCKIQGIATLEDKELERLVEDYGKENTKN